MTPEDAVSSTARPHEHADEAAAAARPGALARSPVLYLYSGDDTLLIELGPVLGARYRTRPVDAIEQIAPSGTAPWALLIDATARPDARAQAARVKQQFPQAPILVVCADGAATDWASPLARGAVCAVVERSAITGPDFEAALEEVDAQLQPAGGAVDFIVPGMQRTSMAWPLRVAIAVAALAIAGGAWYFLRRGSGAAHTTIATPAGVTTPAATAAAAANAGVADERSVLELLSDARVAFGDERHQLPPADGSGNGDSALELYSRVLAQDPQNDEARDGMRRLFAVASARIHADILSGRFDDASRLLAAFQGQGIADDSVKAMQAEVAAERPRWFATQARSAIAAGNTEAARKMLEQLDATGTDKAKVAELQQAMDSQQADARMVALARRVHAAINAGALLEPAADSAQALVQQMQQLNRNHPLTASAQQELQAALAERTRTQEAAAARARADTSAAPAASVPPPPAAAKSNEDYLTAKPVTRLVAEYPQRALEAGQEGYVIVEFMLSADGRAANPRVVDSNPASIFDSAALQAVRRGRFDASVLGNPPQPRRARLRISFKPQ